MLTYLPWVLILFIITVFIPLLNVTVSYYNFNSFESELLLIRSKKIVWSIILLLGFCFFLSQTAEIVQACKWDNIFCFLPLLTVNFNNLGQVAFPYANSIYDIKMFNILNTKIYCHRNQILFQSGQVKNSVLFHSNNNN